MQKKKQIYITAFLCIIVAVVINIYSYNRKKNNRVVVKKR